MTASSLKILAVSLNKPEISKEICFTNTYYSEVKFCINKEKNYITNYPRK